MPIDEIKEKINIVQQMKPNNIADFIPLLIADAIVLEKYKRDLVDFNAIGNDHPIYYFSAKLKIPVTEVAASFAAKSEVFLKTMPNVFKTTLDVLLKHGVDRTTILSCSKVFKHYSVAQIDHRIKSLKKIGLDKISTYMIHTLNSMDYLSNRLDLSENDLKDALIKYPNLKQSSALKIKTHLDFWQSEVGLTANEITNSLYVLRRNVDEMNLRLCEMRKIGAPIKLSRIAGTKTVYLKYIRSYATEEDFPIIEARIKQK
ncbi:uncharacterized protein LOC116336809 isoform X3 [Contarinia nasturtii]|uniref:uncharacterized protein LOC116336809 isoform X3 n=1 Tax=Contarinia nasturtii TaxID=265458 RepID=UPI0012D4A17B|nr:uncharacterized protein LOC116336809 isoform X3 [Contarinia nasturtii]